MTQQPRISLLRLFICGVRGFGSMPHQGNIYLGYNLVLLVQPCPPKFDEKAVQLSFGVTLRAIEAHIKLHLFCRFCKGQLQIPEELISICNERTGVKVVPEKDEEFVGVFADATNPKIRILLDLGNEDEGTLHDIGDIRASLRKIDQKVHVELFRIHPPDEKVVRKCEEALESNDLGNPHSLLDENLYHLASRVCSAFVEYQAPWSDIERDDSDVGAEAPTDPFSGKGSIRYLDIIRFDSGTGNPPRLGKKLVVKKLLDVQDAIDLVCGCLDGAMHYFPPVPDDLKHIFQGRDKSDEIWTRYKFPFGVWFRGSSRICYDLQPTLFRQGVPLQMHDGCTKRAGEQIVTYDECSMVQHFREYLPSFKREYGAMFDWLSLMQHHNAPTRLLDWTENILLALYFAVCDQRIDCDTAVWVLNAGRLNEITRVSRSRRYVCFPSSADIHLRTVIAISHTWKELRRNLFKLNLLCEVEDALKGEDRDILAWLMTDPPKEEIEARDEYQKNVKAIRAKDSPAALTLYKKIGYPVAIYPSRVNKRLAVQLGTFTLHGGKAYDPVLKKNFRNGWLGEPQSLLQLNLDVVQKKVIGKPFLDVFVIPSGAKRKIREQLKRIGVHAAAIFPELEYQSEYMRREWMLPPT